MQVLATFDQISVYSVVCIKVSSFRYNTVQPQTLSQNQHLLMFYVRDLGLTDPKRSRIKAGKKNKQKNQKTSDKYQRKFSLSVKVNAKTFFDPRRQSV